MWLNGDITGCSIFQQRCEFTPKKKIPWKVQPAEPACGAQFNVDTVKVATGDSMTPTGGCTGAAFPHMLLLLWCVRIVHGSQNPRLPSRIFRLERPMHSGNSNSERREKSTSDRPRCDLLTTAFRLWVFFNDFPSWNSTFTLKLPP